MRELRPGLWHWQAPHPWWKEGTPWARDVSSYALDDGERLVLFDPLAVPGELLELAAEREPVIALTAPWHERDARDLIARLAAPIYAPPADTVEDMIGKYDAPAEQAEAWGGSPDLDWLRAGGGDAHWTVAGDRLPGGIEAFAGYEHNDLVLWVESRNALVAGDLLSGLLDETAVHSKWLRRGVSREELATGLRRLLELPVELVLPAHGAPTDRAALERALA
ncbi:MAG: MBL fold metallo-hydrolase [Thermoleophilia bacterium]|nr:MBL fold metallo-hydrolase [Thermoleophilia bacterium]